jgi:hypothetical protein
MLLSVITVILVGTYFYVYPEVLSCFPRTLDVRSSSLNFWGVYYLLPLFLLHRKFFYFNVSKCRAFMRRMMWLLRWISGNILTPLQNSTE